MYIYNLIHCMPDCRRGEVVRSCLRGPQGTWSVQVSSDIYTHTSMHTRMIYAHQQRPPRSIDRNQLSFYKNKVPNQARLEQLVIISCLFIITYIIYIRAACEHHLNPFDFLQARLEPWWRWSVGQENPLRMAKQDV
jgi:hypothetical protein